MLLCKINICFILQNFVFFTEPLSSDQYSKYYQSCFYAVFSTLKQRRWKKLNFHFQPNIKVETTLIHRRWINVILSVLFQRCFINVETMSINILRLNFHFQQNINVETTLINVDNQRWINVDVFAGMFKNKLLEFSINTNWTELVFFDNASFHALLIHS